jgi:phospho-N-acetylmuramoyl-pentapeptide-transferase
MSALYLLIQFFCAALLTFLLSAVLLRHTKRGGATIKADLVSVQHKKGGTPLVGGLAFSVSALIVSLFDSRLGSPQILLPTIALVLFGIVGGIDDLMKEYRRSEDGVSTLVKLVLQALVALILSVLLFVWGQGGAALKIGSWSVEMGWWYGPFAFFYILYFVNAVNITDGLDTLAGGVSLPLLLLLIILPFKEGAVVSTAVLGAVTVFLFFNTHPAQYFMGDCGSHALGGYIALSALVSGHAAVILFSSGIFAIELISSLIQIISIRKFGRKVFPIAPLHHTFELQGLGEVRITRRFILASWILAALFLPLGW